VKLKPGRVSAPACRPALAAFRRRAVPVAGGGQRLPVVGGGEAGIGGAQGQRRSGGDEVRVLQLGHGMTVQLEPTLAALNFSARSQYMMNRELLFLFDLRLYSLGVRVCEMSEAALEAGSPAERWAGNCLRRDGTLTVEPWYGGNEYKHSTNAESPPPPPPLILLPPRVRTSA
jgi:hypothetical protein